MRAAPLPILTALALTLAAHLATATTTSQTTITTPTAATREIGTDTSLPTSDAAAGAGEQPGVCSSKKRRRIKRHSDGDGHVGVFPRNVRKKEEKQKERERGEL